jgi:hypothetical protein
MPFPNEFAAQQENPDKYKSLHRENNKLGTGIDVIWGTLPNSKTEIQTIRFRTSKFKSKEQVKGWLEEHNFKTTIEEPKKDSVDSFTNDCFRLDKLDKVSVYKCEDGSYKGVAFVTRSGVFNYTTSDGKKRKELRHFEDVFSNDSLQSLKMIPITKFHPDKLVTPDNIKNCLIGYTGENYEIDSNRVSIPININTKEGIQAIENDGLVELSCGYELDIENIPGIFDGVNYDVRQRNIKYNHLSLVSEARLGNDLKLNLDSKDAVMFTDNNNNNNSIKGDFKMPKLKIDGIEYEAAQEVINSLEKANKTSNDLTENVKTLTTKLTEVTANYDSMKAQVDKSEKDMPLKIKSAVDERVNLLSIAMNHLDEKDTETIEKLSNTDVKKKIILKYCPDAKLDGKEEIYINARFDSTIELNKKSEEDDNTSEHNKAHGDSSKTNQGNIVETARKKYLDSIQNAYKTKK